MISHVSERRYCEEVGMEGEVGRGLGHRGVSQSEDSQQALESIEGREGSG